MVMMYDQVKAQIEEFWLAQWGSSVPTQFDNVPFQASLTEYAQFTVRFGSAIRTSIASKCYRQPGLIMASIKVRPNTGSARKLQLAAVAAQILCSRTFGSPAITLADPSIHDSDEARDNWVTAQVSCPFFYHLHLGAL